MSNKSAKSSNTGTVSPKKKEKAATSTGSSKQLSQKARREAAIRRQQQQQALVFAIVAGAVLIAVLLAIFASTRPLEAEIPSEVATAYTTINEKGYWGKTAEGYYFIGAENAPVVMEMFSSFSCSACRSYKQTYFNAIKDKIEAGNVKFIYIPLTKFGSFDAEGMSKGAFCAGEQGKYWEMHDVMFDWQTRYASSSNDSRRLAAAAEKLGLDVGKFSACLASPEAKAALDKGAAYAGQKGVQATPTVFLNGEKIYPELPNGGQGPNPSELRGIIEVRVAGN